MNRALVMAALVTACSDAPGRPADGGMGEGDPDAAEAPIDLSAALAPLAESHGLPALGAAAADGTAILGWGVTGIRKVGDEAPATLADRWHLGSDTKAMTATLTALLVESGTLSWDSTLPDLFPAWAEAIDPGYRQVTLAMLLSHVGGAPGTIPTDVWEAMRGEGSSIDLRREAVETMLARPPAAAAGEFVYSNAGYMMVGAALEEATGTAWEELMRQRLFVPLEMTSCGFGPPAGSDSVDQPWGHAVDDGGELVPMNVDNPPALGPAGTVHCALDDWLRFLAEHLAGASGEPTRLALAPSSWSRLQTAWPGIDYAMGWLVVTRSWAGGVTLTHAGSNTLNTAIAWVAPAADRIYLAVTNRGDQAAFDGADQAIAHLIDRFPGL